ncbi:MAG: acetamidase/formamidase family protein [Armatimonadota bacterium]|nr:acetamidase/formamidase family protein [Armatimonadota bacterium]MDR7401286.1 acetamidase/formamidase family protein [Armatimonadota bacterium]MDR7404433.1 acetamidase/formamidase family protein [Armatimonadota bacterium]MDR7437174.1 acetamidase/formamidase family protein [Armatimonadota bacterium]MDR7473223.1 acetamidase/formamidase family protein [Armatimonadota bacterium]
MTHHTLHRQRHHFGWNNALEPALRVAPGEVVAFEVVDASGGQLTRSSTVADVASLDFARVNPVTGPVYVEGARPGDALEVEILDLEGSGWGWTAIIPGFGLLAEDFPAPFLHISTYDARGVEFAPGIRLPVRPFPGTIGVAPAEPGVHSVVPPREVGGNMDIRDLVRGTTLWLPVRVPGALFSVGDTHAAQGDGEVCGTAVESPMVVTLRFGLRPQAGLRRPRFSVPGPPTRHVDERGYHVTTGIGPDLMQASKDAVRDMIDLLGREYRLTPELAYALCSVAVDLRISEVVDAPNWVVSAYLPRSIFV